ncbi:hypothetical protein [Brevibacillus borstelensis]|nr:hypothetical protein [Brevibacillus borstelensis]
MNDDRLERLGTYFVFHQIRERYEITFETFVRRVQSGAWEAYLA